jgi:hypothetical protein
MYKAFLLLFAATLVGCSSGTTPPSASTTATAVPATTPAATAAQTPKTQSVSNADVLKKLQESSGSGATNCGDVQSLSGDALKTASDCAMDAAKNKKAFVVSYNMPGMTVGVAGNAEGKLVTVQSEESAAPKVTPCPADLRIAQSGRVTCMPAGSMGVAPGSGNPHAGQGANPHGGGIAAPAAGTPNPHKTAIPQKSH